MDRAARQALINSQMRSVGTFKFSGYSTEDAYRQANMAAYERLMQQMQRNPGQAVFVTAMGGTFVATPRPPLADVVVESPAIREKPRVSHWKYWELVAVLSIISIWPAWALPMGSFMAAHPPYGCGAIPPREHPTWQGVWLDGAKKPVWADHLTTTDPNYILSNGTMTVKGFDEKNTELWSVSGVRRIKKVQPLTRR